jgi:uncharacterized protein (TIGR03067 family)
MRSIVTALVVAAVFSVSAQARSAQPPKGEAARMKGVWIVVSGERDGKPMDASRIAGRQLVIQGSEFTDMIKGKDQDKDKNLVLAKGTFTLDESHSPRWIDAHFTTGEIAGKSCKAIYEIDGDTFRTVTAVESDDERPSTFKSLPATGQMMFVYRRAK